MNRRRRSKAHSNHERWLVSYADFITLLFAFFVVLYSSSQVDKRKVGKLAVAIQVAFQQLGAFQGGNAPTPTGNIQELPVDAVQVIEKVERSSALGDLASARKPSSTPQSKNLAGLKQELEEALAQEIDKHEVALRVEPDGLVISLREIGFFDSGSAEIKGSSERAFAKIAALLKARNNDIRIEGHTDNVRIHTQKFASNWELSTARATEVIRLLIVQYGLSPERLSAAGYGEFHPVATNDNTEGRQQNRRVDLVILAAERHGSPPQATKSSASVTR
jgi:chemotaxis protein MotB